MATPGGRGRRGLRRELTWRYTWVTVAALVALEVFALGVIQGATRGTTYLAQPSGRALEAVRAEIRGRLDGASPGDPAVGATGAPDGGGPRAASRGAAEPAADIQAWLQTVSLPVLALADATGRPQIQLYAFPRRDVQTLYVIDAAARLLAVTPATGAAPLGSPLDLAAFRVLPRDLMRELGRLTTEQRVASLLNASPETRFDHDRAPTVFWYPDPANGRLTLVTPIFDDGRALRGALLVVTRAADTAPVSAGLLALFGASLVAFTLAAGVVGTLVGVPVARSVAGRLERLARVTGAWSHGDFTQAAADAGPDEIGALAAHLDGLGADLHRLVRTRQRLAASEERNRLARDLHDSVKQQVFAISLNLGTARLRWDDDPAEARARLDAAAAQAEHVQRELAALIGTLRPAGSDGRRLGDALRDLVATWQASTGIRATTAIPEALDAPPDVGAAIYRITQEALANVARHSGAGAVHVAVERGACGEADGRAVDGLAVEIRDDGTGFDAGAAAGEGMGGGPMGGVGLRSMRERAEALGGRWTVASDGTGTRVRAEIPTLAARPRVEMPAGAAAPDPTGEEAGRP